MAKKRKTKARAEYEKARANYLRNTRHYIKKGYFEYAPIPEVAPKGMKAREINKLTKELKLLNTAAKNAARDIAESLRIAKKQQQINLERDIIENYLNGLRKGEGGRIVAGAVDAFRNKWGDSKTARMLEEMEQSGNIITNAVYYDKGMAQQHVSKMESILNRMGVMTDEEMKMTERIADSSILDDEEYSDIADIYETL